MYTVEQISYFLFYRMKLIHQRLDRLQKFLRSHNVRVPCAPQRLLRHHIRVRRGRSWLELWLEEEADGLCLHLDLVEINGAGNYYRSWFMYAPSLDYNDLPSKPTNHSASAATHIARVVSVKPSSVDSLLFYFNEMERWLDRVLRGLEKHQQHIRDQRLASVKHRRFMESLREIENNLLIELIGS